MDLPLRFTEQAVWHETGLEIYLVDAGERGVRLHIGDLNPETNITFIGSRWEIFRIGFWIAKRALTIRRSA